MTPVLTQAQAAELLGLSKRTLERFRVEGRGPTFLKLGRRVVYRETDLEEWLERSQRVRTSELRGKERA